MSSNLATKLREGTKQSHTLAENTAYMKCFLKGQIKLEPFRQLLANLYQVYSILEVELDKFKEHPVISKIYFPELNRKEKVEQDLAYYFGENWREEIVATEAGKRYVNRIKEVAETEPSLLVAHAYVRYLGDLSGGQGLKTIIRKAFNLPADHGTGLHEFDALPTRDEQVAFKIKYRDALNDLEIDDNLADKIVAEANLAFRLNCNVMHSLDEIVKTAVGLDLFNELVHGHSVGSTEANAPELVGTK
jgi:heme oxygenase (biliverdin-producing, ferredoxin)